MSVIFKDSLEPGNEYDVMSLTTTSVTCYSLTIKYFHIFLVSKQSFFIESYVLTVNIRLLHVRGVLCGSAISMGY